MTSRDVPVAVTEPIVQIGNPQPGIRPVPQVAERQELPGYRKSLYQTFISYKNYKGRSPLWGYAAKFTPIDDAQSTTVPRLPVREGRAEMPQ